MISFIVPLYNKENTIVTTLNSVLSVNVDKEVIVVNDGSTDDSVNRLKELSSENVFLIQQDNLGVSAARNRGLLEARGKYVFFVDADDVILPDVFEDGVELLDSKPFIDLVVFDFFISRGVSDSEYYKNIPTINGNMRDYADGNVILRTGNVLIRNGFAERFEIRATYYEDFKFFVDLIADKKVAFINKPSLIYKKVNSSLSLKPPEFSKDICCFLKRVGVDKRSAYRAIALKSMKARFRSRDFFNLSKVFLVYLRNIL